MAVNELPDMPIVKAKGINTQKYVGRKSTIEKLSIQVGKHSTFLKVESEILGKEDGKDIRASMLFGLKQDENGALAIPEKGNLLKLMNNKKVDNYKDLVGKDIIILSEADENGIDWLIFS